MQDWYKRWFGEEYLLVYHHRDIREAERQVEGIMRTLGLNGTELVLDLCCGPGRHDIPLARQGCRVYGLDYSMPLLRLAMESLPSGTDYPRFVRADARHIPFGDGAFDVVLNLFTSFGYFTDEENAEMMVSIARLLKTGGRFYIDYLNPSAVLASLVPESVREKEGMSIIERRVHDPVRHRINKTIELTWDNNKQYFHESVRLYTPDEMHAMIRDAGLTLEGLHGDSDGAPFDDASPRMVLYGSK